LSLAARAYKHFNFTEGERLRACFALARGRMLSTDTWDPEDLVGGGHYQKHAASLALVVGIHSFVGLLGPDILEVLVHAVGHWSLYDPDGIYAFTGREEWDRLL
jgi:hypothetical protein